jgi:succinoglycan biosynthesis transport protein ExoP
MNTKSNHGFSTDMLIGYLAIFQVHGRMMVLLLALSLTVGLTYYTFCRTVFYSRSLVHIVRVDRPFDERNLAARAGFIDSNDQALLQEFASDDMVERTAKRMGVAQYRSRKEYLKKITADYNSSGDVVVELWAYSQPMARDWTETMVKEYMRYRDEKRQERREVSVQTFTREAEQIRKMVSQALDQEIDLKGSNNMSRLLIEVAQLNDIPRDLLEVNRRLALMEKSREALANTNLEPVARLSLVAFIESSSAPMRNLQLAAGQMVPLTEAGRSNANTANIIVVPSMINPAVAPWEELDREKRRLQGQMRQLETTYGSGHPKMVDLRKQVEKVNRALELELEVVAERFDLQYASLKGRRAELEARLPEVQAATGRYEQNLQEIRRIGLNRSAWDALQEQMTRLVTALGFWADKQRVELQFLGHLEYQDSPVAPNRFKILLLTLGLGLALAISIPYLLHYLDTRLSYPEDAEVLLELDTLGLIPDLLVRSGKASGGASRDDGKALAENFRLLRTNFVLRATNGEPTQVILIASALPSEGKTTVAMHMARSFAQKGERTLLIDADLYRGCLHKVFGAPASPGLSDLLERRVSPGEICVPVGENLELMPCGKLTGLNVDLIDSEHFAQTMKNLRPIYQRIIVDSPPILGLSEVNLLQRHTDGLVIVISSPTTPRQAVQDAVKTVRANGGKIHGFVFNRADFSSLAYRYRYYYHSNKYYSNYAQLEAGAGDGETV